MNPAAAVLAGIAESVRVPAECAAAVVAALDGPGLAVLVHAYDAERRELVVVAASAAYAGAGLGRRTALGSGLAGWCASRRLPAATDDRTADRRGDHLRGLGAPEPEICLPIPSRHRYVGGVLEVCGTPQGDPDRLLRHTAALLGAAFDLAIPVQPDSPVAGPLELERAVVAAQEAERRRLAADIHDGISQRLAGLSFYLSAARAALVEDVEFATAQLECARALAEDAAAEARAAIRGLSPPVLDDLGLAEALAGLAGDCPGVVVSVDVRPVPGLPRHLQVALYRVAQEALHNVAKHSGAPSAAVRLFRRGGSVVLEVTDPGIGFAPDPPAAGLGLRGMRERVESVGGRLRIRSVPGRGTRVEVTVPGLPA